MLLLPVLVSDPVMVVDAKVLAEATWIFTAAGDAVRL